MAEFIEIPLERLNPETLHRVIEAFVGREGTDYGHREVTWESKVQDVRRQLERGDARIVFNPKTETTDILTVDELRKRVRQADERSRGR